MVGLYEKDEVCPVCSHEFKMTNVLSRRARVLKRDSDFCPHYKDLNPIYYSVVVCPNCGYTSFNGESDELELNQKELYRLKGQPRWTYNDLNKSRSISEAIKAYKLLLLTYNIINPKYSKIAKACLRLAWLYRYIDDQKNENKYLDLMIKYNETAFSSENLTDTPRKELEIMYILGETYRKKGNYKKAVYWFSKVGSHEKVNSNRVIKLKNREQWSLASEMYRKEKASQDE